MRKYITWKTAYLALGWLCLMVVTAPIYYVVKARYGDVLYFESLATDLFRNGGRWSGWSLSAAPVFFPDMIVTFINFFIFDYVTDKLFVLTLVDIVCIVWGTEYFLRSFRQKPSWNLSFIVLLLMAVISYCVYTTGIYLYAHASNAHIGTWIFSFFCIGFTLRYLDGGRRRWLVWLMALNVFAIINDNLFFVSYTAPAFVTCLMLYLLVRVCDSGNPVCRYLLTLLILLPLSYAAALCLQPLLLPYEQLSSRVPMNMASIVGTYHYFIAASTDLIRGRNPWFFFLFVLWAVGLVGCIFYSLRTTWQYLFALQKNFDFLLYFAAVLTPVVVLCNVGGVLLSGVAQDVKMYRYFETTMALPIAMLLLLANKFYHAQVEARLITCVCIVLAILTTGYFIRHFEALKPRKLTVDQVRHHARLPEKALAECLDNNKEKYDLQYGLADFWSMATTNLFSQKGIRVALVNGPWHVLGAFHFNTHGWVLDQRHYLSNIDWDLGSPGTAYAKPFYNFIIVNSGFTEEAILRQSTAGMHPISFACPPQAYIWGKPTTVLVYDKASGFNELIHKKAIASHAAYDFKTGKSDSITYPGDVLPTFTGFIENGSMNAREGKTKAEFLTFGPIIQLPMGHYRGTFIYTTPKTPAGQTVGRWDLSAAGQIFFQGDITAPAANAQGTITVVFDIRSKADERRFMQMRSVYNGTGNLSIQSMVFERVKQ